IYTFIFNDPAHTETYTLSLHDALPIFVGERRCLYGGLIRVHRNADVSAELAVHLHDHGVHVLRERGRIRLGPGLVDQRARVPERSEEYTSELQSPCNLVCRLLLEKKKI